MEPAAIIITYIIWTDWKSLPFNLSLFVFQLLFLVAGKILGKVEVEWSEIWHAAQVSHVRLCLRKMPRFDYNLAEWEYINFGYPKAKLQYWRLDQCKGQFEYREPMFTFSQERIDNMIQYAYDQVDKKYDWLQLLSPPANFPIWIIRPSKWGKEVIGWFNLPGGREFCSSGGVAVLLWYGESFQATENKRITNGNRSEFFGTYDPAVIPPCLIVLSKKWRKVA